MDKNGVDMSAQIIELMFFAGVAFFLVNKLISILGKTNENDGPNNRSFFGEVSSLKDVTEKPVSIKLVKKEDFVETVDQDSLSSVLQNLAIISSRISGFNIEKFVVGAKSAFAMLISAASSNDLETINGLVDKRFVEQFVGQAEKYKTFDAEGVEAKILELYMFGNSAFIKILFNKSDFKEEWTFTKNTNDPGPNWFVSNVQS